MIIRDMWGRLIDMDKVEKVMAFGTKLQIQFSNGKEETIGCYSDQQQAENALFLLGKMWSNDNVQDIYMEETEDERYSRKLLAMTIEELDFSTRVYNALKRKEINTLGDLVKITRNDCSKIRDLGRKSFEEIEQKMKVLGVGFAEE